MTKFKAFACGMCGERVTMKTGPGREYAYRRGVQLPVPESFGIPTCTDCGEEYLTVERAEELEALLKPVFAARQRAHCTAVVNRIRAIHGVTLREIEEACAVTPTYLSHVLAGRREASATLVYLLEAYALAPAEFARRRKGVRWEDAVASAPTSFQPVQTTVVGSIQLSSGTSPLSVLAGEYRSPQGLPPPANDFGVAA